MAAGDALWNAFVEAMLAAGHAEERRSRYGAKPALVVAGREIAHQEAPGVIDLRITGAGWRLARDRYGTDPAVHRDPSRRDWIELRLAAGTDDASTDGARADLDRLRDLLAIAMSANA
jgi:hypothetical protein